MFADACINGNPRLLSQLCERLRQELPSIGWYAYARVNGFSRELLNEVRRAGCFSLFWGVESNSQSTVDLLGKRFRIEKMHAVIEAAEALGIKSYIHLMYNTPHETMEDVARLIRFVERHIRSDRVVLLPQRFLLEPQSLMFERPGDYGLGRNLERVETSPFERDEFTFEESGGIGREAIASRNRKHRRMLAGHLELIRCRNLLNDCPNLLLSPPSGPIFALYRKACAKIQSRAHHSHAPHGMASREAKSQRTALVS